MSEEEFERMTFDGTFPSRFDTWPTPAAPSLYKINSFWIEVSSNLRTVERKTYSSLEWLGDVGGLFEGLKNISGFFIAPIASFALRVKLFTAASSDKNDDDLASSGGGGCFSGACLYRCSSKHARYMQMLSSVEMLITRQFDVVNLVR